MFEYVNKELLVTMLEYCFAVTPIVFAISVVSFIFCGNHGWGFWSDAWKLTRIILEWNFIMYFIICSILLSKALYLGTF